MGSVGFCEEVEPYYHKSRAPIDVRKGAAPMGAMTPADISEFKGEFGGILYMAKQAFSYAHWPGKDMADCKQINSGNECGECELIMGHSSADYYFYRGFDRSCTLQQVDAHFQCSDASLIKALKGTAQSLLGRASPGSKSASQEAGWDGSGSGWVWNDSEDLAYLYMDTAQAGENTEGVARFQWRRAPLHNPSR